jgi:hypothetical protein
MSATLETRAEIVKLARLLTVDEEEVGFLDVLPAAALSTYRDAATDRLFEADAAMFRRVGMAAGLVPSAIVAAAAERAVGPLVCARAAGCVDTGKAVDVLRRLSPEFVADATVEVDPRRVVDLIAAVPEALVLPVARLLGERREFVTMGRFLAFVPDRTIVGAMGELSDEALLRTAFVLEHKDRLDHAVGLLPADRIPSVLARASELGLWAEALDLMDHLSDERRGPIADVVAEQPIEVIGDLVAAVVEAGIWDSLLPVVRLMSPASLARLVTVPAFHDPVVLESIIEAVAESSAGLWRDLAPLVGALPDDTRATAAEIAGRIDPRRMARIVRDAAAAPEARSPLVDLVAAMDEAGLRNVADAVELAGDQLPEEDRQRFAALLSELS